MQIYGNNKTAKKQPGIYKKRGLSEVGTIPIKKFIKMVDFRQDDLRNIKKFMNNKD